MSVLMTAGKKAMEKREAERKLKLKKERAKQKAMRLNFTSTSTPPMSSSSTTVWYWELDRVPTTVMYNKDRNEVWCNGYILETAERFGDDLDVGGYVDFDIYLDETNTVHQGRIRRHLDHSGFVYQLYVNDCPIMEHTPDPSRSCAGIVYPHPLAPHPQFSSSCPSSSNSSEILSSIYGQGALPPNYYAAVSSGASYPPRYEEVGYLSGACRPYDDDQLDAILKPALFFGEQKRKTE